MTTDDFRPLARRFAEGPAILRAARTPVPRGARQRGPEPGNSSPHEIVAHVADATVHAPSGLRFLLAEDDPVIIADRRVTP